MSKGAGVLGRVKEALRSVGIKAPWAYTGPVASPEYLSHLPKASEYRRVAPASVPLRAVVPHAELDRIYDIKYFVRDTRRAEHPGGSKKLEKYKYNTTAKDEALDASVVPPTPNATHRWSKPRSILDQDNNGYTL